MKAKTTLASIVRAHKVKAHSKVIVRPNSEHLRKSAAKTVVKLT